MGFVESGGQLLCISSVSAEMVGRETVVKAEGQLIVSKKGIGW